MIYYDKAIEAATRHLGEPTDPASAVAVMQYARKVLLERGYHPGVETIADWADDLTRIWMCIAQAERQCQS